MNRIFLGKFGEDAVSNRLKTLGWKVKSLADPNNRFKKSTVSFEISRINSEKKITQRCLVDVKTRKPFAYKFNAIPCLALPSWQCKKYDDYYKKCDLPLYLFWADFYNKEIYMANFREIFDSHTKIDGEFFPLLWEIQGMENYLFPKTFFKFFGKITDEEYQKWHQALEHNLRNDSNALSN